MLSDHHWADRARGLARGLREMARVARRRAVLSQWDQRFADAFWLTRDDLASGAWERRYGDLLDRPSLDPGCRLLVAKYE